MGIRVSPRRILVVDDEPLIRWSIAETLGAAGYQVTEAENRASALEALASAPIPDVVLLDLRLPDSNDLGLLTQIRRIAPKAAVVMMTAFGSPDVRAGALELGARKVLDKPFDMHVLADVVGSL